MHNPVTLQDHVCDLAGLPDELRFNGERIASDAAAIIEAAIAGKESQDIVTFTVTIPEWGAIIQTGTFPELVTLTYRQTEYTA